jgi:hypothetical protein
MTGSKPNIPRPTSCPTRSISVSARSSRRWRPSTPPVSYDPADIAIAGVFVSLDADGSLSIDRGYVRPRTSPEAEGPMAEASDGDQPDTPAVQRAVITIGGQPAEPEDDEEDGIKPLPERLVIELTAHRTLALRNARGGTSARRHDHAAAQAGLSDTFMHTNPTGCLEANVRHIFFSAQSEELKDSPSAQAVNDRHERWGDHIPADDQALWDWLTDLDDGTRMELLAHCVSYGVNALFERPNPYRLGRQPAWARRASGAGRPARAGDGLDMVAGRLAADGRQLSRPRDQAPHSRGRPRGAGERAAQLIDHMKKGDMAKEAERLLADSGWLPEPLRLASIDGDQSGPDDQAGPAKTTALPDFLTEDGEDEDTDEDEESSTPSPPNSADRRGAAPFVPRISARSSTPPGPTVDSPRLCRAGRAFSFQEPVMADYFTHFSCLLDVGTPENAARALDLYNRLSEAGASEEPPSEGFLLSIQPEHGGTQLWMRDDVTGDPERLIQFVKRCAAEFGLTGRWGFQYANTCSKPRLDGFGGGAHVLDLATGETVDWIYTDGWLDQTLSDEGGPL